MYVALTYSLRLIATWQMADNGVVSRYRGNELHCSECIRVTIGKEEENQKFLATLTATWASLNA